MKNLFIYNTDLGKICVAEYEDAITDVWFGDEIPESGYELKETKLLKKAGKQLLEYTKGKRNKFDLPLIPVGTEYQKKVWVALLDIPYAQTRTYKQIAEAIGNPKAARAIGMANNKNPIAIIIPCHRVIGANGKLVGYASGLYIKEKLLNLESENNRNLS